MSSRRKFIQKTSVLGAGTVLVPSFSYGLFNGSQNDKLNVGLIGAEGNLLIRDVNFDL